MGVIIRHCVECPKCGTRYLIAFSPYANGSCLVSQPKPISDEFMLYCSCSNPPAISRWTWQDLRRYSVTRAAHTRGYGSPEEIVVSTTAITGKETRMSRNKWLRISAALIIVAFVASRSFAVPQETLSCTSPEYRQVEFWIGDWDVYERESARGAHVRVDRILDGCVLREHYDNTGAVGESFTIYDVARKLWHQTWVTNRGRLLTIEGGPEDHSSMVLAGAYYRDNSEEVRVRGTWQPVSGGVRESADTSV